MTQDKRVRAARKLSEDVIGRYAHLMDDKTMFDAVVLKAVALVALAYGFPIATADETVNVDQALDNLRYAEEILKDTDWKH
jgi:hypothetical protein